MEDCNGKQSYRSRKAARGMIKASERTRQHNLRAYKCDVCHYWHLTSADQLKKRREATPYEKSNRYNRIDVDQSDD